MTGRRNRPSGSRRLARRRVPRSFAWHRSAAFAALLWERLWPALFPAAILLGLFIASAWLGLWRLLAPWPWPHAVLLALLALGLVALLVRGFLDFRWPGANETIRRLEQASGLSHRPLQSLSDRPAGEDSALARAVWRRHLARQSARLKSLRIGWPRPDIAALDPYALRAVAILALVVGLAQAGGTWGERLSQALEPGISTPVLPVRIDAWINPPAYTGLAPIYLTREGAAAGQAAAPLAFPIASTLQIQVHGGSGRPEAILGGNRHPFTSLGTHDWRLAMKIGRAEARTATERLVLRQDGRPRATWNLAPVPDHPPKIAFVAPPDETVAQALRVRYHASDDYGVTKTWLEIRRATPPGGKAAPAKPLKVTLPLDSADPRNMRATSFLDLTRQVWAGLNVKLTLVAEDAIGQQGRSESLTIRLPEHPFHHPVARALIEQRRLLATDPANRPRVALALSAIALLHHAYRDDLGIFLSLGVATRMLRRNPDPRVLPAVEDMLWDGALALENGDLGLAMQSLRQAENALRQALAQGAPQSTIEQRLGALKGALAHYLAELARLGASHPSNPLAPPERAVSRQDLERLLDRTGQLAHAGARAAARAMLDRLQAMLENLRPGAPGAGSAGSATSALGRLLHHQRDLLDQTFSLAGQKPRNGDETAREGQGQATPGPRGGGPMDADGPQAQKLAGAQDALQGRLGKLLQQFQRNAIPVPKALDQAGTAMGRAAAALRHGAPQSAIRSQANALEALRQGARALERQQGGRAGAGRNGTPRPGVGDEDPLGRPADGFDTGDEVRIPEHGDLQQSRKILDELYRRAGDPTRPGYEIDYIDRLLDRF